MNELESPSRSPTGPLPRTRRFPIMRIIPGRVTRVRLSPPGSPLGSPPRRITRPRSPPMNRGVAFEIHNASEKINAKMQKYLELISSLATQEDVFYTNQNIIEYIKPKFVNYIQQHFPEDKKESSIQKLNSVLNKLADTPNIVNDPNKKLIIGKTVDFVFSQPNDFIEFYIDVFIQDCYHAYSGMGDNRSCAKGIYERFYMVIKDTCHAVCPDPSCTNVLYNKLKLFFKDLNEITQEWGEQYLESPEFARMNKEERKQHFIHFMKEKYRNADILNEEIEAEIMNQANKIDYVFETLSFGGTKKKKTIKKIKKIKKHKTRKIKKSRKYKKIIKKKK
jgi:hypothetical protein